jgi:HTH-type transcriptional regulator/antitoxin HigA
LAQTDSFTPRWASPPGDTIRDVLDARGISVAQFAEWLGISIPTAESLINGDVPISVDMARRMETSIGGSIAFWVSRDGQYRDDLSVVAADRWAGRLPIEDMTAFGWIERPPTWQERIATVLAFFAVPDLPAWDLAYGSVVDAARFRLAAASRADAAAIAVWLRQAEIESERIETGRWDPAGFQATIQRIRPLTSVRDPRVFLPDLTAASAQVGVSVVLVRAPRGCPASGAARFLTPQRPQIILSGRYLSDDHLWFTFYHEAAHLLLHDPAAMFVDEFEEAANVRASGDESDADAFAGDMLLPPEVRRQIPPRRLGARDIVRAARTADVSPGIVVGQLQHLGVLGFSSRYSGFKRRYRWAGTTLERA